MVFEKLKSISVFFPAYGDEGTIEKMVLDAIMVLKEVSSDFEIIVVDDKSPDKSGEIADKLAKKYGFVKVVHHKKNMGYGGALKSGFAHAKKEWVFYTDGDNQYDVFELKKLVDALQKNPEVDIVNGYKIKRHDPLYRTVAGKMYNFFAKLMFGIKIRDIDCDFRLIRRKVFGKVKLESDSGVICVEMVKKIQDAGFNFAEVPVHHYNRTAGKSQFFRPKKILKVFMGLAKQWIKLVLLKPFGFGKKAE